MPAQTPAFGSFGTKAKFTHMVTAESPDELVGLLKNGMVKLTFKNASGELVTHTATLAESNIPDEHRIKQKAPAVPAPGAASALVAAVHSPYSTPITAASIKPAQPPRDPNLISFFSEERQAWRAMRFERLITILV